MIFRDRAKMTDQPVALARDQTQNRLAKPCEDTDAPIGQPIQPGRIADCKTGSRNMDRKPLDRGLVDQGAFCVAHGWTFRCAREDHG